MLFALFWLCRFAFSIIISIRQKLTHVSVFYIETNLFADLKKIFVANYKISFIPIQSKKR